MKKFNLELAKAGHPVQTRDGKKVRIICWDAKYGLYPIIALIENPFSNDEHLGSYTIDGYIVHDEDSLENNLVMTPEKHEGWVYLFKACDGLPYTSKIYNNQKEAERVGRCAPGYVDTIKIEWEE